MRLIGGDEGFPTTTAGGGVCYLCGNDSRGEPVLDLERNIEFEGDLMFCWRCVADIIHLAGSVMPSEAQLLRDAVDSERQRTAEVEAAFAAHKRGVMAAVNG